MRKIRLSDEIPMISPEVPRVAVGALSEIEDYNIDLMNVPTAWKKSKGEGVKVVVLDTGVPVHKDIVVKGHKSFVSGYEVDKNGHGTFSASIIGATAGNNMGIKGIAPECELYCGAVLGKNGTGTMSSIIAGIYWAVNEVHADIINMSLGIPGSAEIGLDLKRACDYAESMGVTLFASAGNDAGPVGYPAAYDSVVAVAAVDANMKTAPFSSRGPEVEFAAGGVDCYGAYLNNGYAKMSGTSFSCPAVAGVAALIIGKHKKCGQKLTPMELREHLRRISHDINVEGRDDETGYGIPVFSNSCDAAGTPKKQSWWKRLLNALKIG